MSDAANRAAAPAVRSACDADGRIAFGIWRTRDFSSAQARAEVIATGARLFVAEAEIPAYAGGVPNPQAQDWVSLAASLEDLELDLAVATSWAPFTGPTGYPAAEIAKPLIDAGWYVLPYVYPAENPGVTIEGVCSYADHFTHSERPDLFAAGVGWYHPEPVLGVYGGVRLEDFPTRNARPGFSLWDASEVL